MIEQVKWFHEQKGGSGHLLPQWFNVLTHMTNNRTNEEVDEDI